MHKLAGFYMKAAVLYALTGFALGMFMGAKQDFTLRSVHSHINLLGWVSMAICAAYYQLVPAAAAMRVSKVHFWVANAGMLVLTISVGLLASGYEAAGAGAAAGSLVTLASAALFTYIVFKSA